KSAHVARIRRSRNPGRHGHPGPALRIWPVSRITLALIRATRADIRFSSGTKAHVARIRRSRNPGRHGHPGPALRMWPVSRITLALIRATRADIYFSSGTK
ncbi:hypothetical protein, partial [Legionella sp. CNM-4043-24]|uniref:hypothetical protein n=1 Tax=Legionella sp. CNM-4043-24 TaxID=3421646 RepID=UPI00403ACE8F